MNPYASLFLLLGFPLVVAAQSPQSKTIDTPEGKIKTTKTIVAPTPQKIIAASASELSDINDAATQAKKFVSDYLPGATNPQLADFDKAFRLWQIEKTRRYTKQQTMQILGAFLGNKLARDFQMEWVVVSDQYGTDYAVRAKKKEVMSFPFSSVAKRIEDNEHEFIVGIYHAVKDTLAEANVKGR